MPRSSKLASNSGSGRRSARKKKTGKGTWQKILRLTVPAAVIIIFAAALYFYSRPVTGPPAPGDTGRVPIPAGPIDQRVIAVIIDDVGHNKPAARAFIDMDYPVALSILPDRPFSKEIAGQAAKKGKTVMLHLPMEPMNYPEVDPGPGAILLTQTSEEIREILGQDISSLTGIVGINNHMGSAATADRRVMEEVLSMISEKNLFFIDSRTTPETVALEMARGLGIPSARRDVFLDNEPDPSAIDARMDELLDLADKKGWAIGIGHARTETAKAMERLAAKASERNIRWIDLKSLITYADPGD